MPAIHYDAPAWAERAEVNPGDILIADGDFTCIDAGTRLTVERDLHSPDLYVRCSEGKHYLDGQLDDQGRYVGLFPPEHAPC
ncbi:MAG TPA: hypothetical protein VN231_05900 [Allosphingosinicella sp.]|nr:hypothetical protein [Allosphingosinicella sp.]